MQDSEGLDASDLGLQTHVAPVDALACPVAESKRQPQSRALDELIRLDLLPHAQAEVRAEVTPETD